MSDYLASKSDPDSLWDYELNDYARPEPIWCSHCGCNVARRCVCAKDCGLHPLRPPSSEDGR